MLDRSNAVNPILMRAAVVSTAAALSWGAAARAGAGVEATVTQHDVIPRLLLRCTVCHGGRRREGELDLRTKASMLQGGKSGAAIVPVAPEESLLLRRIHGGEMPPRRRLVEVSVKPMQPSEMLAAACPARVLVVVYNPAPGKGLVDLRVEIVPVSTDEEGEVAA